MGKSKNFEKDFLEAIQFFPLLKYSKNDKEKKWIVSGELEICDQVGDYWETFLIRIDIPTSYPYCLPTVKELSALIRRDDNWHISADGECCLDIEHRLLLLAKRGINLTCFIREKVYPYFANQIYKQRERRYAAGEYSHYFDGVVQFYQEELNIGTPELAVMILKSIISNKLPNRNELCICGNKKFKHCHLTTVECLKCLPIKRLKEDLEGFTKLIS